MNEQQLKLESTAFALALCEDDKVLGKNVTKEQVALWGQAFRIVIERAAIAGKTTEMNIATQCAQPRKGRELRAYLYKLAVDAVATLEQKHEKV